MKVPLAADLWSRAPRVRWWQRVVQLAPVRIVLGWLLFVPLGVGVRVIERYAPRYRDPSAVALTLGYLLLFSGFAKFVERRPASELSGWSAFPEWLGGVAVGLVLMSITVGTLTLIGAYRVWTGGDALALVTSLATFLPAALLEELLFRAILFKIAEEAVGTLWAVVVQAAMFGALHLGNPSATWISSLAIAVEAGLLLAAVYLYTRRIWLAWGLHFGWNWAQGALFGVPVSGTSGTGSWLRSAPVGSPRLNGGGFGVEASPVAVMVCLVGATAFLLFARKREPWVRFRTARDHVLAARRGLV